MSHVALWSHSQRAFHVELLAETIRINQRALARQCAVDYVPIFVGSESDCRSYVDRVMTGRSQHAEQLKAMFSTAP